MKYHTLNNQMSIPALGFGTYKIEGNHNYKPIVQAIEIGYRLIDTAAYYDNEEIVAQAIQKSEIPREELTITTKVWRQNLGYDRVLQAVEDSRLRLQLDYIDIVLLHWPANQNNYGTDWPKVNQESWRALEELYQAGIIKAIGISNYTLPYLKPLLENVKIMPMINQLEFHPGYWQPETFVFCREHHVLVQAWSPLARGKVFDAPIIQELASKYHKSEAQICLRWIVEKGVVPIPKTTNRDRMVENFDIFDFSLSADEVASIDSLPKMGYSGHHPDNRQ